MDWLSSLKTGDRIQYDEEILTVLKPLYFWHNTWKVRVSSNKRKRRLYIYFIDNMLYFHTDNKYLRPLYSEKATVIPATVLKSPQIQQLAVKFLLDV